MLIGLNRFKACITDMGGGKWLLNNKPEFFGSAQNIGLGTLVLVVA